MKRIFPVLLTLFVSLTVARSQGFKGKILIVRDSVWRNEDRVEALLPHIYAGTIDSMSSFPAHLSQYDAILFFVDGRNEVPTDSISIEDKFRLIDYLKNGGKLYAQGGFFLSGFEYPDTLVSDTLWRFLGLQFEAQDAVAVSYYAVHGVDSEFTKGIDTSWQQDPFGLDGDYFPNGNISPVLFATADENYIFAWIPSDRSLRAVVHHADEQIIDSYYDLFLTRVLCDYFGLCTDAVHSIPSLPQLTVRVVNDGFSNEADVTSQGPSILEIWNEVGSVVYRRSLVTGETKIPLPIFSSGLFFARVNSGRESALCPFIVGPK